MKKQLISIISISTLLFSSDPITLDSMFKTHQGLRGITTLQMISSGHQNYFSTYPDLVSISDGSSWNDVKMASLSQAFMYGLTKNIDGILSANASATQKEHFSYLNGHTSESSSGFDSLWVGGVYSFERLGVFIPDLALQVPLYQKDKFLNSTSNSSLKSCSAKVSFKNYSDPVISRLFLGTIINQPKQIGENKIDNGDLIFGGFDLSVILSPKISLDFGMEQRHQSERKINNVTNSNSANISTLTLGATYSITSKSSLIVSGSIGGSSQSPDSITSVSFWQKF